MKAKGEYYLYRKRLQRYSCNISAVVGGSSMLFLKVASNCLITILVPIMVRSVMITTTLYSNVLTTINAFHTI